MHLLCYVTHNTCLFKLYLFPLLFLTIKSFHISGDLMTQGLAPPILRNLNIYLGKLYFTKILLVYSKPSHSGFPCVYGLYTLRVTCWATASDPKTYTSLYKVWTTVGVNFQFSQMLIVHKSHTFEVEHLLSCLGKWGSVWSEKISPQISPRICYFEVLFNIVFLAFISSYLNPACKLLTQAVFTRHDAWHQSLGRSQGSTCFFPLP